MVLILCAIDGLKGKNKRKKMDSFTAFLPDSRMETK